MRLLVEAFRRFRAAGLEEAQLGVASTHPGALRGYERLGMTPRFRCTTARPHTALAERAQARLRVRAARNA